MNWYTYTQNRPTAMLDPTGLSFQRQSDKCQGHVRDARDLRRRINEHFDELQTHPPDLFAASPNGTTVLCAGGGKTPREVYKGHRGDIEQLQTEMLKVLKKIRKDCNKKQKEYFRDEIGAFEEVAERAIPEWAGSPYSDLVPMLPLPLWPVVPAPAPAPVPLTGPLCPAFAL